MNHERKVSLRLQLNAEVSSTGYCSFYELYKYEQKELLELAHKGLQEGKTIKQIVNDWRNS